MSLLQDLKKASEKKPERIEYLNYDLHVRQLTMFEMQDLDLECKELAKSIMADKDPQGLTRKAKPDSMLSAEIKLKIASTGMEFVEPVSQYELLCTYYAQQRFTVLMVVHCLCDADGNPLYSNDDEKSEWLDFISKNPALIIMVMNVLKKSDHIKTSTPMPAKRK